ncbi:glycoside hydrolase family 3 protein [Alkalihalobacillus trypoxylicola]|uniref:Beta-N-acetylhexosaminidase n=1 Tax=Alkalihalobacillus trypoxylicola TaxID=519424 RepID=A0A161PM61_9BACI|nr:glycoside hydrolase family 3 N-terminal domain-containing protein [Alkalihalobacillus trypoxylicola]KYG35093.1 beta-N-acetylhexosaminidase [Alkalihalobacillus trypoxylicola]
MPSKEWKYKIGQMMVFGFKADQTSSLSPAIAQLIKEYSVGGVILFGRNIGKPEELLALTTKLQAWAQQSGHQKPLFICTDQENGAVRRLGEGTTVFPGAMLLGAADDVLLAEEIGMLTGKELKALGINWNLAPTVDVNNNPNNPVIGVRSFGEDASRVSQLSCSWMKGIQKAGVISTLKHFPGHGDTVIDSHLALPTIHHPMERLVEVELKPFQTCIDAGADIVMTSHIHFPALESRAQIPATLSYSVMTELLRNQLGFRGVTTTDCLEMDAISKTIGTARGAVEAIKAGVDLIMISNLPELQYEALEEIYHAFDQGELTKEMIESSYQRIQLLKKRYLNWTEQDLNSLKIPPFVGSEQHQIKALQAMKQGITLVENKQLLPLSVDGNERVLVVYPEYSYLTRVEDQRFKMNALSEEIKKIDRHAQAFKIPLEDSKGDLEGLIKEANQVDVIIIATISAVLSPQQQQYIKALSSLNKKIIGVACRVPYDRSIFPYVDAFLATYEFNTSALQIAARVIYGLSEVHGKLPVTIKNSPE